MLLRPMPPWGSSKWVSFVMRHFGFHLRSAKSIVRFSLLSAILIAGAAVSSGPAHSQNSVVLKAVAVLLETEPQLALPVRQRKAVLTSYYVEQAGPALWIGTQRMPELIDHIGRAEEQGLLPRDYAAGQLKKLQAVVASTDARSQAVIELYFSAFFLKYASDIKIGRLLPGQVDKDLFWKAKTVDLVAAMTGLSKAGSIADFVKAWEPQIPEYGALKTTLIAYRKLAERGGWPKVPAGEVLKPEMIDERVPVLRERLAATDGALPAAEGADPNLYSADVIDALKRFQKRHGLETDGVLGKQTLFQLNVSVEARIRQIVANLERWRWMPEDLGQHYVMVNIAGFELKRVRKGRIEERMRVVVGLPYHRTPVFSDRIKYLEINPYWNVPYSIATKEYLPQLRRGTRRMASKGFEAVSGNRVLPLSAVDWGSYSRSHFPVRLRQRPGPSNALGRVKFMFPNRFNVYLHDTQARSLFGKAKRAFSHGCIRLARPIDLAEQLLSDLPDWNRNRIQGVLDAKDRTVVNLAEPVDVHLTYATAWQGEGDTVHFAADIYRRDEALHRALFGKPTPS